MTVSAQDVKKLREMTGVGMMDCKEALAGANGDFDLAVELLRKKGLSRAAKKAGRETREGLVEALVRPVADVGALVEINCETDFVARTDEFRTFVKDVVTQVDRNGADGLLEQAWLRDPSKSVQTALAELIGKLGENMQVARAHRFEAPANGCVHAYIHPGARVGVLIEISAGKPGASRQASVQQLVHDLAMQVAAAQPRFVRREEVDAATMDKEREIAREQLKDSGKAPQVIEKIVDGKVSKFFEEFCLVDQPFIKDPNVKVGDLVTSVGKEVGAEVAVTRFVRYVLGEAF